MNRDTFLTLHAAEVPFLPTVFNSEWYADNKELIENHLLLFDGTRPLVYGRDTILTAITCELLTKKYMLDTLYDTMNFDYNPIWNVDGTETLEYTRENTGTVGNSETGQTSVDTTDTSTLTRTGTDTTQHSISESETREISVDHNDTTTTDNDKTGTETLAHSGTVATLKTGTEEIAHAGTVSEAKTGTEAIAHSGTITIADDVTDTTTTSKTAYNDTSFVNAEKVVDVVEKDTTTTNANSDTTTYNTTDATTHNNTDTTTFNTNETTTYNNSDTTTYNVADDTETVKAETTDTTDELTRTGTDTDTETLNLTDTERKTGEGLTSTSKNGTRTDNLTEEYTETKTRGGNIGVTSTQSLINQEREVARFSFIEVVCKTITDAVCMGVYD